MALRICLVTPFAWSQPHDVNEHVAGVAGELRALGHAVTVLAPSTRASELLDGRRALARRRHGAFPSGAEAPARGSRVARGRAAPHARRDPDAPRAAGLGARPAPDEAADCAPVRAARAPAARPRADGARCRVAGGDP